jgi:hypothetical protein
LRSIGKRVIFVPPDKQTGHPAGAGSPEIVIRPGKGPFTRNQQFCNNTMKKFKRYLITSALPYANGPIHIGHLAGVYVPSDIYTRYLRLRKREVIHVCGSDEHGVPITIQGPAGGYHPEADSGPLP